jgi:MFS transporter, FHS family, Na+ dependent glucose transporter 1
MTITDARPSLAGRSSTSFRGSHLYLGAFIALGCESLLLGPSLTTFQQRTGLTSGGIGVLFTWASVGYLAGSLLGGRILDRVKAHAVMASGLVLIAAALVGIAFSGGLATLAVTHILLGFGGALVDTTGNTVVLWVFQGGPVMNALHGSFAVGGTLAPGIVALSIRSTGDLRWAYCLLAGLLVVGAYIVERSPSPTSPHIADQSRFPRHLLPLLAVAVLYFVLYVGVELGFIGWINKYAVAKGLSENAGATALNTGFLVAFTAGRILGIPISARLAPKVVLALDVVACCVGLIVLLVGGSNHQALWVGTVLFGLGTASMFASMLLLIDAHLPTTGAVTSSFLCGAAGGSMLLPWLIGKRIDAVGASAMPKIVLIGVVGCGLVVVAFSALARRLAPVVTR